MEIKSYLTNIVNESLNGWRDVLLEFVAQTSELITMKFVKIVENNLEENIGYFDLFFKPIFKPRGRGRDQKLVYIKATELIVMLKKISHRQYKWS